MTPEELTDLVERADTAGIVRGLAGLSEAERRKLSKTGATLLREIRKYQREQFMARFGASAGGRLSALMQRLLRLGPQGPALDSKEHAAAIAVLGVCPVSEARKVDARRNHRYATSDDLVQVLSDRRPDWIGAWLDERFKGEWPSIDWDVFWRLYKAGVCAKPTTNDYYRFMAKQLNGWSSWVQNRTQRLRHLLADEPVLLADVWKLFEVDTDAFAYDWDANRPVRPGDAPAPDSWASALLRLAQRGIIDRQRLLDATIAGQTTGFKQNRLAGMARLHEKLEPTIDEMTARQSAYAELLAVPTAVVVSFAIGMLKKIEQAGRLNDEAFVADAARVFSVPTKGPAKTVVSIFKKIGKRSPQLIPRASRALAESALVHPAADVASAAFELLEQWRDKLDAQTMETLADRLDGLPATVQARAHALVAAQSGGDGAPADVQVSSASDVAERVAECRAAAMELPARWRELAGVDAALAAVDEQSWPPPLAFRVGDAPVLSGLAKVRPIQSVDELLDVVAHTVEQVDDAMDFERILDGVSRLGLERTPDFERRAAPIVKRIGDGGGNEAGRSVANWITSPVEFRKLLGWWLAGNPNALLPADRHYHVQQHHPPIYSFLNRRCLQLRQRLQAGTAGPLLSTPTHASGWLDPRTAIQRWRESHEMNAPLMRSDVVLALLRLAPDHRPAALADAASLEHPWEAPLRWALGDCSVSPRIAGDGADVWIAAANARLDEAAFAAIAEAGAPRCGPSGSAPARYSWRAGFHTPPYRSEEALHIAIDVASPVPDPATCVDRPSVLLHLRHDERYWFHAAWFVDFVSTLHPADASGLFAEGVAALMRRIHSGSSSFEPNYAYITPLFDVDRPLDDLAHLLVCVGFCGKDQDAAGMARDALIQGIGDGRIHESTLGAVLANLAIPGWLKLNRMCANLAEAARVSSLHAWTIGGALESLLGAYAELPRDAHHLLVLVEQLHVSLGRGLGPPARQALANAKAGGKTAKLSKSLLAMEPHPTPAAMEARISLVQGRLARAQRWAAAEVTESMQPIESLTPARGRSANLRG